MSDNKTPQASIKCVGTGLIFGEIKCPDCSRTGFGKIKDSPTPLSAEEITSEEFIREKIRDKYKLKYEMNALCMYDVTGEDSVRWSKEFSDQQTTQLRKQLDDMINGFSDPDNRLKNKINSMHEELVKQDKEITALKERNEKMATLLDHSLYHINPNVEFHHEVSEFLESLNKK